MYLFSNTSNRYGQFNNNITIVYSQHDDDRAIFFGVVVDEGG